MRLKEDTLLEARKLSAKNPCVAELIKFYESIVNNSAYESYVARKVTLNNWDADLINNKPSLFSKDDDEEKAKARDKEVDRVLKYLEKQTILFDQTEVLLTKLVGDELEALNKDTRIRESQDRAFRAKSS